MIQKSSIAAFPFWKRGEKRQDAVPKINWQRQDRPELDHDRVHLPKAVLQVELEQRFDNAQMAGRADGQKLSQAFNDPEQDRQEKIIHKSFRCLDVESLR